MEERTENQFKLYWAQVRKYVNTWDAIEINALAIKGDNNVYYLQGLHATLITNVIPMYEILLNIENVIMLHEIKSLTKEILKEIIFGLEKGYVKIGEYELRLEDYSQFDFNKSKGHNRGPIDVTWNWPFIWLRAYGNHSVGKRFDEDIINRNFNRWGYEDLRTACIENLGFSVGGGQSPSIHLISPMYISSNAQIEEDKLVLTFKCHKSIDLQDISASYHIEGDSHQHEQIYFNGKDKYSEIENFIEIVKTIDIPINSKSVRYWTFYQDDKIDENWTTAPIEKIVRNAEEINPIWKVMDLLYSRTEQGNKIQGTEIFKKNLGIESEVSDEKRFEIAVSNLMSLAGFQIVFSGKGFELTGVDTLAFSIETQEVLVISSTIANNIGDKVRTLLNQINKLEKELEGFDLIPSILSPIEKEIVKKSDFDDAEYHKIALLLNFEIKRIFEKIQTTPVSEIKQVILDEIKSNIKSVDALTPFL